MQNRLGISWYDWLAGAGYTTGTIMQVSAERHRILRTAWHDCSDPTDYRPDTRHIEVIVRTCKDVATSDD